MKILTIGGQKGGTGKSTLAANLAVCAATAAGGASPADKLRVVIIDADPQGSSVSFRALRAQLHDKDDVHAVAVCTPTLHRDLSTYNCDLLIIDTGGRDSVLFRSAVMAAANGGLVLLPTTPSPYDIWAMADTLEQVIAEARCFGEVDARVCLSMAVNNSIMLRESMESMAELQSKYDVGAMATQIGNRAAFKNATAVGLGVVEFDANGKAAEEITALWLEIKTILGV